MDVIFHMNEHETGHTPPVLDTLIQNRPIQMLKAIVPYLYGPQQRMISMMVRMIELQRTMQLFDAAPEMQAQELRICYRTYTSDFKCTAGILYTTRKRSD